MNSYVCRSTTMHSSISITIEKQIYRQHVSTNIFCILKRLQENGKFFDFLQKKKNQEHWKQSCGKMRKSTHISHICFR